MAVVVRKKLIALAVVKQAAEAKLLQELLQPIAPYRVEVRGNALLLYLPAAAAQAAVVRSCLRPR